MSRKERKKKRRAQRRARMRGPRTLGNLINHQLRGGIAVPTVDAEFEEVDDEARE